MITQNFNRSWTPVEYIAAHSGEPVVIILKDNSEVSGVLLSCDENANISVKVGEITRIVAAERVMAVSFG